MFEEFLAAVRFCTCFVCHAIHISYKSAELNHGFLLFLSLSEKKLFSLACDFQ